MNGGALSEDFPSPQDYLPAHYQAVLAAWKHHEAQQRAAAASVALMSQRNNVLLLTGSEWNPEQNLQEEERRVISFDDFRAGRITISDPALLNYLDKNPNDVLSLAPRQFEELVAELLKKSGYEVHLGAGSRDGGVDVRALRATDGGLDLTLVQCKRWDPSNKVGEPVVKELYGSLSEQNATHGLIVTTSTFSSSGAEVYGACEVSNGRKGLRETVDVDSAASRGEMNGIDARLWHPWLRINRVLRVMLHTRWSES